jgi:DNA-binding Lrp family transcriptional regulator
MTQAERDRLMALKKAKKKLITQEQSAEEIGVTERQVRRLLRKLREKGDRAVIHELRGRPSNRKLSAELEQQAVAVLLDPVYRGFGPTLAAEYLHKKHRITVSKETLRQWMVKAGLWEARRLRVAEVHQWRPRRSRCGELVQWDTSTHDWLEGRGRSSNAASRAQPASPAGSRRRVRGWPEVARRPGCACSPERPPAPELSRKALTWGAAEHVARQQTTCSGSFPAPWKPDPAGPAFAPLPRPAQRPPGE